jgi:hypothetical protein
MHHPQTDKYLFSKDGKVKSLTTGKLMKTFLNPDGYEMVNITFRNGRRICRGVHRMVVESFFPYLNNSELYEVNHMDGNKLNNNLSNLEWVTRSENLEHARVTGLYKSSKGELNSNCKFNNDDIKDMRQLYNLGFKIIEIAKAYNSNRTYVGRIVKNKKRTEVQ